MIVTGVGTRKVPVNDPELDDVLTIFCNIACKMNWHLRSGGAVGMDTKFESRWVSKKSSFRGSDTGFWVSSGMHRKVIDDPQIIKRASEIAKRIHPNWKACDKYARALHTRNIFQILGKNLDTPSDILVYYAKFDVDGISITGGTRTAVHFGRELNIPEYNLILPDDRIRLLEFVETQYREYQTQQHLIGHVQPQ